MDILIRRVKNKATITPRSIKGEDWIRENMLVDNYQYQALTIIDAELVNDILKDFEEAGLTVEVV